MTDLLWLGLLAALGGASLVFLRLCDAA